MFFCGTLDNYLRACKVTTGRKLFQAPLPAGAQATPLTYRVYGKHTMAVTVNGHVSFANTLGGRGGGLRDVIAVKARMTENVSAPVSVGALTQTR